MRERRPSPGALGALLLALSGGGCATEHLAAAPEPSAAARPHSLLKGVVNGHETTGSPNGSRPAPPPPPVPDGLVAPPEACPVGESALSLLKAALARESGEGRPREDVALHADGDRATLDIARDGLLDDSIASTRRRYALRWEGARGWILAACEPTVVRCYRGPAERGRCP